MICIVGSFLFLNIIWDVVRELDEKHGLSKVQSFHVNCGNVDETV